MGVTYVRFEFIAGSILFAVAASLFAAQARSGPSDPSLILVSSASEASPDGIVSVVLAGTHLPEGAPIILHAPLKGDLWVGSDDCGDFPRVKTLIAHATVNALLCMTSSERQSVRAVATVSLPGDQVLIARSEPVKFYVEHWWSSAGFLSVLTTLLGAAAGIAGTLLTQRADHSRKVKDEAMALQQEQASFVVKSLLPELLRHAPILTANSALQPGDARNLQSLPRPNLIQVMGSPRATALAAYFSAQGNAQVKAQLTDYCDAADGYNDAIQGVLQNNQSLGNLEPRKNVLMTKLEALGVAG
jgi:hypothetical protein